jgi:hypothetical protein
MTLISLLVGPFAAILVAAAISLLNEPARRHFSAIFLAGAGAAYLSGGLMGWEFGFCAVITWLAYRGLEDYRFIAAGWVLHTMWDLVHHFYGNPIVPFVPTSSAGCATCDLVLAWWYLRGARPVTSWFRARAV